MGIPSDAPIRLHRKFERGDRNKITDVQGVRVGQVTLQDGEINTGVTAVLPHCGNIFRDKVMAGCSVLNGFGKSIGLVQIQELGTIETPIVMTNTLSIGTAFTALTKYMLEQNEDIGVSTGTVNCLVTECNDGRLNDIRGLHVREEHVRQALDSASDDFEEGAVGAGTGMVCLGLKGGIGSASRKITADGGEYVIGALVMTNYGSAGNLVIDGIHYDTTKAAARTDETSGCAGETSGCAGESSGCAAGTTGAVSTGGEDKDRGSVIILIATDLPLSERQLTRVSKRAMIALARTGSYCGNGSGDIAITFTTANRCAHYSEKDILKYGMFFDENIDRVFEASVEAVEEALISSLYHAKTTEGVRGSRYMGLKDFLNMD
ncbi:DmpA family aminopeptidase [Hornefia butyriciproducens]|uniref:P1 family peptidase n=1 Tax=Hornefia butyriciproducens TaxID=2652293 RepID=A0A6L5Y6W4_9FIRM|nr:P1 family peptidase [Hornefia butyriciproducens]MST52430.1 P1 family peptidase [Hornefia butyriciproducens]